MISLHSGPVSEILRYWQIHHFLQILLIAAGVDFIIALLNGERGVGYVSNLPGIDSAVIRIVYFACGIYIWWVNYMPHFSSQSICGADCYSSHTNCQWWEALTNLACFNRDVQVLSFAQDYYQAVHTIISGSPSAVYRLAYKAAGIWSELMAKETDLVERQIAHLCIWMQLLWVLLQNPMLKMPSLSWKIMR